MAKTYWSLGQPYMVDGKPMNRVLRSERSQIIHGDPKMREAYNKKYPTKAAGDKAAKALTKKLGFPIQANEAMDLTELNEFFR